MYQQVGLLLGEERYHFFSRPRKSDASIKNAWLLFSDARQHAMPTFLQHNYTPKFLRWQVGLAVVNIFDYFLRRMALPFRYFDFFSTISMITKLLAIQFPIRMVLAVDDILMQNNHFLLRSAVIMSSPTRILAVDVGTGTQDILLFESGKTIENNFKLIMPSPTVIIAGRIKRATTEGRPLLLTGVTMGGGPCHWAARDHALAGYAVAVTPEAGRTFDDDLTGVEKMGFEIIDETEAVRRAQDSARVVHIELQDFDAQAIITAFRAFDVDPRVDALAIAAFDHGAAPPGVSDRRFRFDFIERTVRANPLPSAFAYLAQDTPAELTRLRAVANSASRYLHMSGSDSDVPLLLMDTGSAAVLGALEDPRVREQQDSLLCNIGNFHTLAFHLVAGHITGIFEHHTGEINQSRLEELLLKLARGTLSNEEVFADSGHGALLLRPASTDEQEFPFLAITGPRRSLLRGSHLQPYEATPHGDMMAAGCYGLLRAFADHYPALAASIEPSLLSFA